MARTALAEADEKRLPAIFGYKHGIAALAARPYKAIRTWILEPRLPSHAENCLALPDRATFCATVSNDPFYCHFGYGSWSLIL